MEPVALFPWAMIWRSGLDHPGLDALHAAVDELPAEPAPHDAWLPEPEAG